MADVQWGIRHVTPADNLATEINNAQQYGQKTVYLEAGDFQLSYTAWMTIKTDNFTLRGAGAGSTIIHVSPKYTYEQTRDWALIVQPDASQGKTQIERVRLADFTLQMDSTLTGGNTDRRIGILLKDCREFTVERVWVRGYLDNTQNFPFENGFQVYSSGADALPSGGIAFDHCGCTQCLYGVYLGGTLGEIQSENLQRCSFINPAFRGKKTAEGQATGGSASSLIDSVKNFNTLGVQPNYIIHNYTDAAYGRVHKVDETDPHKLVLKAPGWVGGRTNLCQSGDAYMVAAPEGDGIHIDNAKGTLVLGGAIAIFTNGVYIGPTVEDVKYTRLSQVIGPKFDDVDLGVYIGGDGTDQTQVIAITRANEGGHISDNGEDSLIVDHQLFRIPVEAQVYGLLNASTPRDLEEEHPRAGTITRFGSGAGTTTYLINQAFGNTSQNPLPDGFVGIYYDSRATEQKYYLVSWINSLGVWKKVELTSQ